MCCVHGLTVLAKVRSMDGGRRRKKGFIVNVVVHAHKEKERREGERDWTEQEQNTFRVLLKGEDVHAKYVVV